MANKMNMYSRQQCTPIQWVNSVLSAHLCCCSCAALVNSHVFQWSLFSGQINLGRWIWTFPFV